MRIIASTIFLCLLYLAAGAQIGFDDRAWNVPRIFYESQYRYRPAMVFADGDSIALEDGSSTVNPTTGKIGSLSSFAYRNDRSPCDIIGGPTTSTVLSENGRFVVYRYLSAKEKIPGTEWASAYAKKTNDRATICKGFVRLVKDTPWVWCTAERDYVMAVTNDGRLVTTEPVKVKDKKNSYRNIESSEVVKMRGLSVLHPMTGKRQTIHDEAIKDGSGLDPQVSVSDDGSFVLAVTSMKEVWEREATLYSLATGKKMRLEWTYKHGVPQMGKALMLVSVGADKAIVFRMSDGVKLLEHTSPDSIAEKFYLTDNDEVCFYDVRAGTIAVFGAKGDELKMVRRIALEQDGLVSQEQPYHFMMTRAHVALFPVHPPAGLGLGSEGYSWAEGAKKKYAFPVFFDLKTGKATGMIRPFYKAAPSAADLIARHKEKCKFLTETMKWPVGSLLSLKDDKYGMYMTLAGVDCERESYKLDYPNAVHGSTYKYWLYDYIQIAAPGKFSVCSKCKGVPHTREAQTVADNSWEQVNFNIYVRSSSRTKTQYVEFNCDRCKGRGFEVK